MMCKLSVVIVTGLWLGGSLAGCASGRTDASASPDVASVERYASAFEVAKAVLRDEGFVLERVDARAGVITTQPKTTAGVLTPWHEEQSTMAQEFEDLLQRQQRVVRVTFVPKQGETLTADVAAVARVDVTLQRVQVPGLKLESESIRQRSYFVDPELADRGMQPSYAVAWKEDERLAARIANGIGKRAGTESDSKWRAGTPVDQPGTSTPPPPPPA